MEWWLILILVIVIAVVALPAALIWFINIAGIFHFAADARERKRALRKGQVAAVKED
jgi:flagellar basal body-associated protein FliL